MPEVGASDVKPLRVRVAKNPPPQGVAVWILVSRSRCVSIHTDGHVSFGSSNSAYIMSWLSNPLEPRFDKWFDV